MTGIALRNRFVRLQATVRSGRAISRRRHALFESLEYRQLLATITVNAIGDDPTVGGPVSIREAINEANANVDPDVIEFDASLNGETILLTQGQLEISNPLTINGPGQKLLTIDAQQNSRVLNIEGDSIDVSIAGLALTGGRTTNDNSGSSDASNSGGGIRFFSAGALTLTESALSGNSTAGIAAFGGGIFALAGSVTLTDSTLSGNSTEGIFAYGGGIFTESASVTLSNSTVSGNSTAHVRGRGGGVSTFNGSVTLTNSTVSGNSTAGDDSIGGGIFSHSGSVTLTNSTISGNSTAGNDADGGGILVYDSLRDGALTINNSIVAGNAVGVTSRGPDFLPDPDAALTIQSSLIGDTTDTGLTTTTDGNQLNVDWKSVLENDGTHPVLTNNGGPTETIALRANSPAIDAGSNALSTGTNDQRGVPFTRDAGTAVDLGAYERQTLAESWFVVTTTIDELEDSNDDVSLREAISSANGSVGADTITFTDGLSGTIALLLGQLEINDALTITGPGQESMLIDARQQSRVMTISEAAGDVSLAGLTITGGRTTGDNQWIHDVGFETTNSGAGIRFLSDGALTLIRSTISGNSTAGFRANGSGISNDTGSLTLVESTVSGNRTEGENAEGGGIFTYFGSVTLTDTIVSQNQTDGVSGYGGGVSTQYGNLVLTNSTVSGNSTSEGFADGGGIFTLTGSVALTNSTVSGNSTVGDNAHGGGIYSAYGSVSLTNSNLSGNNTTGERASGSGIFSLAGSVTLTDSNVSGNSTAGDFASGGGIRAKTGSVTLSKSTVSGNITTGNESYGDNIFANSVTVIDSTEWRMAEPVRKSFQFSLTANNSSSGGSDSLEAYLPLAWQNFLQPGDVNNDGIVQASDALRIINELARREYSDAGTQVMKLATSIETWPHLYYDQNGDNMATALDALRIINELGRQQDNEAMSEGEAIVDPLPAIKAVLSNFPDQFTVPVASDLDPRELDPEPRTLAMRLSFRARVPEAGVSKNVFRPSKWPLNDDQESNGLAVDQLLSDSQFLDDLILVG